MKKKLILLPVFMLLFMAFSPDYVPTSDEVNRFYETKTLVVLEDNPICGFNLVIKEFMDKEWKLTPYDFISASEFETKRMDPKLSFILLTQVRFDKDKSMAKYNFLSLVLGGNEKIVSNMPDMCPMPLSYSEVDEDNYIYKLQTILRFMQNHVELIHKDPSIIRTNVFKYYNKNLGDIKSKTLYLVADELASNCNTEAKIKKIYPYKFKIVNRDDVAKAIDEKDDNAVFLHKVGPEGTKIKARCYKAILGAADSRIYYWDWHNIDNESPDGLLVKDFKKMGKE
jgi:hypothetical protein